MMACEFCGGETLLNCGEPVCLDKYCIHARYVGAADLDELLASPAMEEKMAQVFDDNNGDSPAAKWWLEMERPKLLREFWEKRYREIMADE